MSSDQAAPARRRRVLVEPWSSTFLQGDVFTDVPLAIAAPPDAVIIDDGERRFVSGPFDATLAMLISPSCSIVAQGPDVPTNAYAHPVRTLVPLRPVEELVSSGAVPETNLNHLRSDRLRNYIYLPAGQLVAQSAALLHMPISMHHDVIAETECPN